jgi:hypothetical protein
MVLLACRCMSHLTCVPVHNEVLLVKVETLHSDCFSYCLQHEYYNHELYPLTCATIKNHTGLDQENEEATISCLLLLPKVFSKQCTELFAV